jgi:hypothetical protein
MGKLKLVFGLAILVLAVIAGWQIASCELANYELAEEMRDMAVQTGAHIGLGSFKTDEEFRDAVIRSAERHEIQLAPQQVTVQRTGTSQLPIIFLAADYKARVNLLGFSFTLHFHPTSAK